MCPSESTGPRRCAVGKLRAISHRSRHQPIALCSCGDRLVAGNHCDRPTKSGFHRERQRHRSPDSRCTIRPGRCCRPAIQIDRRRAFAFAAAKAYRRPWTRPPRRCLTPTARIGPARLPPAPLPNREVARAHFRVARFETRSTPATAEIRHRDHLSIAGPMQHIGPTSTRSHVARHASTTRRDWGTGGDFPGNAARRRSSRVDRAPT